MNHRKLSLNLILTWLSLRTDATVVFVHNVPWHSVLLFSVDNCPGSLTVVTSSNIGLAEELLVNDEGVLLTNVSVELSRSVLEDLDDGVDSHLSTVEEWVVFGTSAVGELGSELLFCQNSVKLEDHVTVENEVLLSFPAAVIPSVVLSADVVTIG